MLTKIDWSICPLRTVLWRVIWSVWKWVDEPNSDLTNAIIYYVVDSRTICIFGQSSSTVICTRRIVWLTKSPGAFSISLQRQEKTRKNCDWFQKHQFCISVVLKKRLFPSLIISSLLGIYADFFTEKYFTELTGYSTDKVP